MITDPKAIASAEGEERCPFCGAKEFLPSVKTVYKVYKCGTEIEGDNPMFSFIFRGRDCYERQLSQQAELIRQALEVLKVKIKTQSLIPALEEALEKVK